MSTGAGAGAGAGGGDWIGSAGWAEEGGVATCYADACPCLHVHVMNTMNTLRASHDGIHTTDQHTTRDHSPLSIIPPFYAVGLFTNENEPDGPFFLDELLRGAELDNCLFTCLLTKLRLMRRFLLFRGRARYVFLAYLSNQADFVVVPAYLPMSSVGKPAVIWSKPIQLRQVWPSRGVPGSLAKLQANNVSVLMRSHTDQALDGLGQA